MKISNQSIGKKIRINLLKLTHHAKSSHLGSALSIVEILTILYNQILNKKNGDKFLLSKGHACLALYCVLFEKKIINKNILFSYGKNKSILMNHVSHHVPGVIFSTGSLGHGLPVSVGLALSSKIKKKISTTYVLLSDGELNEGTTWEALMFASHHNLNNLCVIIDYNKIQSLDTVSNTLALEPLKKKFQSFGCKVFNINGHNYKHLNKALSFKQNKKPKVIIANTIKGKGVTFMENKVSWHYKSPNKIELKKAIEEVENA